VIPDVHDLPSLPIGDRRLLPAIPAVYFVICDDGQPMYIGQTVNLKRRWMGTHHQRHALSVMPDQRIAWLEVANTDMLIDIETACIAHFRPVLNAGSGNRHGNRGHPPRAALLRHEGAWVLRLETPTPVQVEGMQRVIAQMSIEDLRRMQKAGSAIKAVFDDEAKTRS
jgi:GIY-YIG catalytic domain